MYNIFIYCIHVVIKVCLIVTGLFIWLFIPAKQMRLLRLGVWAGVDDHVIRSCDNECSLMIPMVLGTSYDYDVHVDTHKWCDTNNINFQSGISTLVFLLYHLKINSTMWGTLLGLNLGCSYSCISTVCFDLVVKWVICWLVGWDLGFKFKGLSCVIGSKDYTYEFYCNVLKLNELPCSCLCKGLRLPGWFWHAWSKLRC